MTERVLRRNFNMLVTLKEILALAQEKSVPSVRLIRRI